MAGLPWYCIWSEFSRHGKTRDLCGRLRDRNAGMYVIRLFEHCADQALDGRIPAHVIEEAAGWRGRGGVLLSAMEAAGILDVDGEMRIVHGWVERNGARIQKWLRDNAKPRGNKAHPSPVPHGTDAGPTGDSRGTGAGSRADSGGVYVRSETEKKQKLARSPARAREERPDEAPAPEGEHGAEAARPSPATGGGSGPHPLAARAVPTDDDIPPRRLLVADVTELPEPAASVRAQLEQRLGYQCDLAEGFAEEVERLGEERALEVFAQAATEYIARTNGGRIQSLAFFVAAGRRHLAPALAPTSSCREWDAILAAIRELPADRRLSDAEVQAWLEPLVPRLEDGVLRLVAPTLDHAARVRERYVGGLRRLAAATLGGAVPVEIEAVPIPVAVAGGAS